MTVLCCEVSSLVMNILEFCVPLVFGRLLQSLVRTVSAIILLDNSIPFDFNSAPIIPIILRFCFLNILQTSEKYHSCYFFPFICLFMLLSPFCSPYLELCSSAYFYLMMILSNVGSIWLTLSFISCVFVWFFFSVSVSQLIFPSLFWTFAYLVKILYRFIYGSVCLTLLYDH